MAAINPRVDLPARMSPPGARRTGRAWWVLGVLVAVMSVGWGTVGLIGLLAHEERDVASVVRRPVRVLEVDSASGRIEVVGEDRTDIAISARVSDGFRPTSYRTTIQGDHLQVDVDCPLLSSWCRVDLRIQVPADLTVDVRSGNDKVVVRDLSGQVRASSENDSVEAIGLSGDATLTSSNDSVKGRELRTSTLEASSENDKVQLEFVAPPRSVIARSDNGSVEVAVPDDGQPYDVAARSDNGSVSNDIPIDQTSTRSISARSDNGSVRVRYLR